MTNDDEAPTLGDAAIYQAAELTPELARYWLAMDGWAAGEAAHLLLSVAPDPERLAAVTRLGWFDAASTLAYERAHAARLRLLKRAGEAGALTFPARPAEVIAWAMAKGMRLPAPLVPLGAVVRAGRWTDEATKAGESLTKPVPGEVAGTRWTPERLEELRAYRDAHGTTKAAAWAKVSASRVRALLPSGKPAKKGYSAFTHRLK